MALRVSTNLNSILVSRVVGITTNVEGGVTNFYSNQKI
jgi:hypothetical protein